MGHGTHQKQNPVAGKTLSSEPKRVVESSRGLESRRHYRRIAAYPAEALQRQATNDVGQIC
eukprot:2096501-Pyramimonas_sp.AAC.1